MKRRYTTLLLLCCAAIPFGCDSPTEPEVRIERIAFYSRRDGGADIYIMRANGSDVQRLTNTHILSYEPAISPDGRHIAFSSNRGEGRLDLYVMSIDGSGEKRLTNGPTTNRSPAWSPDGRYLAFSSDRTGIEMLYILEVSTGEIRPVPGIEGTYPDWSPDGGRLIYNASEGGRSQIFSVRPDGTGRTRLSDGTADDFDPDWSPDGQWIAFEEMIQGAGSRISIMRSDGSGRMPITPGFHRRVATPEWSPDGHYIAYDSSMDTSKPDIYVISVADKTVRQLTHHEAHDGLPSWR